MSLCRFLILCFLICFTLPNIVLARLMGVEELLSKVLEANKSIRYFVIHVNVKVYNPEAKISLTEENKDKLTPYEVPQKSFQQKIVWIRDKFLGIETQSKKGNPLHIYIEYGEIKLSKNLTKDRFFVDDDIYFPANFFYSKKIENIYTHLNELGVDFSALKLTKQSFRVFYQIGRESNYILINPTQFRVEAIQQKIHIKGRSYQYKMVFGGWKKKKSNLPKRILFFIKNRLIKELEITKVKTRRVYRDRYKMIKTY
ncbi:MAG: hypothetical protein ACI86H_002319, partial [bacterium]